MDDDERDDDERDDDERDDGFADDGFADDGFADDGFADDGFADDGFGDDGFADDGFVEVRDINRICGLPMGFNCESTTLWETCMLGVFLRGLNLTVFFISIIYYTLYKYLMYITI